jgi:hypothetical protein
MNHPGIKAFAQLPLFAPGDGVAAVEPPGAEEGYWAGGASAVHDGKRFWLSYRLRTRLLDHGRAGRGGETCVAVSDDGASFRRVWSAPKDAFQALSIEKSGLVLTPSGKFRLYVSSVSLADWRWRIDMMEADSPERFDPATRVTVLSAESTGTEGVKDPVIVNLGGLWHLLCNFAPRPTTGDEGRLNRMHREGNCFVSGEMPCPTGLATSADGVRFDWHGAVIPCGESWDRYLVRITALVWTPPVFTAIYDGRPNTGVAYCENPGLALSTDLRNFHKIDHGRGILRSPHARGGLRYIEALHVGDAIHYFYEMARPDGAHELRAARVPI